MAGHNKWSKIKHKKAATDAKRGKEFTKLARLIIAESKKVGGDESSPALKAVITRAKAVSMPKANIERAVAKGKAGEGEAYDSVTYETYGPGGVAVIIDSLTDNRNRTAAEIRHLLSKLGYELAAPGSASWAFAKEGIEWKAQTLVSLSDEDLEKLSLLVDALDEHDDVQNVVTNAE